MTDEGASFSLVRSLARFVFNFLVSLWYCVSWDLSMATRKEAGRRGGAEMLGTNAPS